MKLTLLRAVALNPHLILVLGAQAGISLFVETVARTRRKA